MSMAQRHIQTTTKHAFPAGVCGVSSASMLVKQLCGTRWQATRMYSQKHRGSWPPYQVLHADQITPATKQALNLQKTKWLNKVIKWDMSSEDSKKLFLRVSYGVR